MQFFVVNFHIDKNIDIDNSTIPIYFKKINLVESFWTVSMKKSIEFELLINEFKRKFEGENLLNSFNSSKQFFEFLDYYADMVVQCRTMIRNLNEIVNRNEAYMQKVDG